MDRYKVAAGVVVGLVIGFFLFGLIGSITPQGAAVTSNATTRFAYLFDWGTMLISMVCLFVPLIAVFLFIFVALASAVTR